MRLFFIKKLMNFDCHIKTIIITPQNITAPRDTATPIKVSNLININTAKINIIIHVKIRSMLFFSSIVSCVKKPIVNIV